MKKEQRREQYKYASVLEVLSIAGLIILVLGFILYVSGVLPAMVSPGQVPDYWGLSASEFLQATGRASGWSLMGNLEYGDAASFIGINFLAAVSIVCLIAVLPYFIRTKDRHYAVIVLLQIIVLLYAASGVIG